MHEVVWQCDILLLAGSYSRASDTRSYTSMACRTSLFSVIPSVHNFYGETRGESKGMGCSGAPAPRNDWVGIFAQFLPITSPPLIPVVLCKVWLSTPALILIVISSISAFRWLFLSPSDFTSVSLLFLAPVERESGRS